jgi:hypothetical protein
MQLISARHIHFVAQTYEIKYVGNNVHIRPSSQTHVLCLKLWNGMQQNSVLGTYITTSMNVTLVHIDLTEENGD